MSAELEPATVTTDRPNGRHVVAHEPGPTARDVEELWYRVQVEELGHRHPYVDHRTRRVSDAFAEGGHLLTARDRSGHLLGTCMSLYGGRMDLGYYRALFGLGEEDAAVSVTTKLVVAPEARLSRVAIDLACTAYAHAAEAGVEVDHADCQPNMWPRFRRLGYRRMDGDIDHPLYGRSHRLRLVINDVEHLRRVRSPFLRLHRSAQPRR